MVNRLSRTVHWYLYFERFKAFGRWSGMQLLELVALINSCLTDAGTQSGNTLFDQDAA